MGQGHFTPRPRRSTRRRKLPWRTCLRKGCGRRFRPRQHNQWYCQERECLRKLRRWQAAKRQRKRRSKPDGRQRHAEAERQRRKRGLPKANHRGRAERPPPDTMTEGCAWSRNCRKIPGIFCDRPGCYEPPRDSPRAPAHYCGDDCGAAMRRVRDRRRKWFRRKTKAGQFKRHLEYEKARAKRRGSPSALPPCPAAEPSPPKSDRERPSVLLYVPRADSTLGFQSPTEAQSHDSQTSPDPRSRSPPSTGRVVVD
jgi:hypothetical protein